MLVLADLLQYSKYKPCHNKTISHRSVQYNNTVAQKVIGHCSIVHVFKTPKAIYNFG